MLFINSLAILHETRLLKQYGLDVFDHDAAEQGQIKAKIANLLYASRYLRDILVLVNVALIFIILI